MEQEQTQIQENDNQVFEKYVEKRNKRSKIALISILSVSLVLVVALLFLSLWKVNIRPDFLLQQDPQTFEVTIDGTPKANSFVESDEEYDQILKLYQDTFNIPFLTALFTTQVGDFVLDESNARTQFNSSLSSLSSNNYLGTNSFIRVKFGVSSDNRLTIKANGGKDYDAEKLNGTLTFDEYYIALPSGNQVQDIQIAIPAYSINFEKGETPALVRLTLRANVNELRTALEKFLQ